MFIYHTQFVGQTNYILTKLCLPEPISDTMIKQTLEQQNRAKHNVRPFKSNSLILRKENILL